MRKSLRPIYASRKGEREATKLQLHAVFSCCLLAPYCRTSSVKEWIRTEECQMCCTGTALSYDRRQPCCNGKSGAGRVLAHQSLLPRPIKGNIQYHAKQRLGLKRCTVVKIAVLSVARPLIGAWSCIWLLESKGGGDAQLCLVGFILPDAFNSNTLFTKQFPKDHIHILLLISAQCNKPMRRGSMYCVHVVGAACRD